MNESKNISLNFSDRDLDELLVLLKTVDSLELCESKSEYELARFRGNGCTVIVYSSGKVLIQGIKAHSISKELLHKLNLSEEIVLGIDESGRGEDFGVFTIAAVLGDKNKLRALRDSKKIENMKAKKDIVTKNALAYVVVALSPEFVDECRMHGLTLDELQCKAVKSFSELFNFKKDLKIAIDGKPLNFCPTTAEYLVKGDDINPVIGAASVIAKYAREQSKNKSLRLSWGKIKSKNPSQKK